MTTSDVTDFGSSNSGERRAKPLYGAGLISPVLLLLCVGLSLASRPGLLLLPRALPLLFERFLKTTD